MMKVRHYFGRYMGMLLCAAILLCSSAGQAAPATGGERELLSKYPAIKANLEKNQFGAPIYLQSTEADGSLRVDMYGIFNHPFDAVREALSSPANWCDITLLHINNKACTYKTTDYTLLTLYSGRKHYQRPSDAYPLKLKYRIVSQQPTYLDLLLNADEGPFRTKNHRITLQAAPLDATRTFVHFGFSYAHSSMTRVAINGYFSTLGQGKVGFSTVKQKGRYVYVDGVRGAVERNTVRYYLALQSYMDTLRYPESQRFEQRINRWYDLTAKYPRQLKELEKGEYLSNKRQERKNQIALQKKEGS
jgi:hypothetical protein